MGVLSYFQKLGEMNERLKKRVHSIHIPLSPFGQQVMKVVYFSTPIIFGLCALQFSSSWSENYYEKSAIKVTDRYPLDAELKARNEALIQQIRNNGRQQAS